MHPGKDRCRQGQAQSSALGGQGSSREGGAVRRLSRRLCGQSAHEQELQGQPGAGSGQNRLTQRPASGGFPARGLRGQSTSPAVRPGCHQHPQAQLLGVPGLGPGWGCLPPPPAARRRSKACFPRVTPIVLAPDTKGHPQLQIPSPAPAPESGSLGIHCYSLDRAARPLSDQPRPGHPASCHSLPPQLHLGPGSISLTPSTRRLVLGSSHAFVLTVPKGEGQTPRGPAVAVLQNWVASPSVSSSKAESRGLGGTGLIDPGSRAALKTEQEPREGRCQRVALPRTALTPALLPPPSTGSPGNPQCHRPGGLSEPPSPQSPQEHRPKSESCRDQELCAQLPLALGPFEMSRLNILQIPCSHISQHM